MDQGSNPRVRAYADYLLDSMVLLVWAPHNYQFC